MKHLLFFFYFLLVFYLLFLYFYIFIFPLSFPRFLSSNLFVFVSTFYFLLSTFFFLFFFSFSFVVVFRYVGNTPGIVTESLLANFLGAACVQAKICPENPVTNVRLNGKFCFVEFRTPDIATRALNLNQIEFGGHNLRVSRPKSYIGPQSHCVTWNELLALGIDAVLAGASGMPNNGGGMGGGGMGGKGGGRQGGRGRSSSELEHAHFADKEEVRVLMLLASTAVQVDCHVSASCLWMCEYTALSIDAKHLFILMLYTALSIDAIHSFLSTCNTSVFVSGALEKALVLSSNLK